MSGDKYASFRIGFRRAANEFIGDGVVTFFNGVGFNIVARIMDSELTVQGAIPYEAIDSASDVYLLARNFCYPLAMEFVSKRNTMRSLQQGQPTQPPWMRPDGPATISAQQTCASLLYQEQIERSRAEYNAQIARQQIQNPYGIVTPPGPPWWEEMMKETAAAESRRGKKPPAGYRPEPAKPEPAREPSRFDLIFEEMEDDVPV